MATIKFFSEVSKENVSMVGGKGGSLGEMTQAGLPVPRGFVITTEVYRSASNSSLSSEDIKEIQAAYDGLNLDRVAVRSSAIAEDSPDASWAGQFETVLNVNRNNLIEAVEQCWRSAAQDTVRNYADKNNTHQDDLALAVVVQQMIDSEVSGVIFCKNPVTNNESEIMMEACWGLGEMLVQGMITPDNYLVDKNTYQIVQKSLSSQVRMMVNTVSGVTEVEVEASRQGQQKLPDESIIELSRLATQIEHRYGSPQDIEWAMSNDQLYILQSRPITT